MRRKIYEWVYVPDEKQENDWYDWLMFVVTVLSIVPLMFHESTFSIFQYIEYIAVVFFVIDYILRLVCADLIMKKEHCKRCFFLYPFTFMALVDLLSILSAVRLVNQSFRLLKTLRLIRIVRIFKLLRYSRTVTMILNVFRKQKDALVAVCNFAIAYIFLSALVIFNVEPESFETFFDAIYWATVSLTTVGYGDIYPITDLGRIFTMISSVLGIAIVALPAGIISAGYMDELRDDRENRKKKQEM